MEAPGLAGQQLTIKQAPFSHEGFASTGAAARDCLGTRRFATTPIYYFLYRFVRAVMYDGCFNPQDSKKSFSGLAMGNP